MERHYRFGPLRCAMQDFFSDTLWGMWHWKLDAYETAAREADPASLHIEKRSGLCFDGFTDRVYDERSGFFRRQVFKNPEGDMLWRMIWDRDQATVLACRVSRDWRDIVIAEDNTQTAGQAMFEFMGRMALYAMTARGVVAFHGVLMEHEGRGIIIAAPSGVGKTTHARLWRDTFGSLVINGDNACCYRRNGVWTGFGIPWCGTSGENVNREAGIAALVVLERGAENRAEQLDDYESFTQALPMLHCPVWDRELSGRALDGLSDFLDAVPVYRLECRPEPDAARLLKSVLEV